MEMQQPNISFPLLYRKLLRLLDRVYHIDTFVKDYMPDDAQITVVNNQPQCTVRYQTVITYHQGTTDCTDQHQHHVFMDLSTKARPVSTFTQIIPGVAMQITARSSDLPIASLLACS